VANCAYWVMYTSGPGPDAADAVVAVGAAVTSAAPISSAAAVETALRPVNLST
jgi:hypothetical protein